MIVYKIKFVDAIKEFFNGAKEYVLPAALTGLAYSLVLFVAYYPSFNWLATKIVGITDSFNVATFGLFTMLGSVFHADFYFYLTNTLYNLATFAGDGKFYALVGIMTTTLFSLTMLIAPSSILLINSLAIADVEYKAWIKHIWKLFLALFVVAFIVFVIVSII